MPSTIEVIPHRVWVHAETGRQASVYGAAPMGAGWSVKTRGYTWELVRPDGSVTVGLCRAPVATRGEALTIAHRFASQTGASILGEW